MTEKLLKIFEKIENHEFKYLSLFSQFLVQANLFLKRYNYVYIIHHIVKGTTITDKNYGNIIRQINTIPSYYSVTFNAAEL